MSDERTAAPEWRERFERIAVRLKAEADELAMVDTISVHRKSGVVGFLRSESSLLKEGLAVFDAAFADGQASNAKLLGECESFLSSVDWNDRQSEEDAGDLLEAIRTVLRGAAGQRSQEGATDHLAGTLDEYRNAPSGEGPLAYTWQDKPHRLLYDLVGEVETLRAALAAKEAELAKTLRLVGDECALKAAAFMREDDLKAQLAAQQEELALWRKANVPTDDPNPAGPSLCLNAYGRRCYDAGRATRQAENTRLWDAIRYDVPEWIDHRCAFCGGWEPTWAPSYGHNGHRTPCVRAEAALKEQGVR